MLRGKSSTTLGWSSRLLAACVFALAAGAALAEPASSVVRPAVSVTPADATRLAQAAPAPATPPAAAAPAAVPAAQTSGPSVGSVVSVQGSATATRNGASRLLKVNDEIFKGDLLATSANSSLGVIFDDETTFNLTANASIAVDDFVYQDGGSANAAVFNVAKGTAAFVASAVAKTGDMKITTPTAALAIRGTTGLVEVGQGGAAGAGGAADNIKLYPDADGHVGRIEINGRNGGSLGVLTQGASGFAIRAAAGGRLAATALQISPQQVLRDQGIVRQLHAQQSIGRGIVTRRRNEGRGSFSRPQQPRTPQRPGLQQPGVQRPGPQQPGLQRPDLQRQQLQQPGLPRQNLQQQNVQNPNLRRAAPPKLNRGQPKLPSRRPPPKEKKRD